MLENTKGKVGQPGAVPGASTDLSPHSITGKEGTTEQCSVGTTNGLPTDGVTDGRIGDGKELPVPTVFWCLDCLDEGVHTALAIDGPSRELCEAHRREREEIESLKASMRGGKCARKGCDRPRGVGIVWCRAHSSCASSVSCTDLPAIPEEHEQPNDRQPATDATMRQVFMDAVEFAWQRLAEDARLDAYTVAVCKRLRDLEVRS